jgi:DNA-binding NarL/FixJ family response regulator
MMFTSKIREVARQLGVTVAAISVAAIKDPAALPAPGPETRLVILDLRLPEALPLLALLARSASHQGLKTIGFVDHERTDVMDAARAAGCSDVMAKGQFSNQLPKLLAAGS